MAEEDELIDQAVKLIKKKDKPAAMSLLLNAVKINPKSEQALTLLAETSDDPVDQRRYLKRANKIKADNAAIKEEIRKLKPEPSKIKVFWNKTNRLGKIIVFLVITLIPTLLGYFNFISPLLADHRMTGEWNIALAGFSNLNTDLRSADINLISNVFSNRFSQDMEAVKENTNLVIQVWGPDVVKPISGSTAEERAISAENMAEDINADVLVYGTIQKIDDGYVLQPEFYVRADNYYEADELVGQHRFGGPISILATKNNFPTQVQLNTELTRRSTILALVARGLSLYLTNLYEEAYQHFKQANMDEFWQIPEGRETIYLFQGNAAIRMQKMDLAKQAYSQSIVINPEYGRGYIGMGNIYYSQASDSASQASSLLDMAALEKAKDEYQHALQIADRQPDSAEIPSKAAFGLGQVYLVQWFSGLDTHGEAIQNFQKVLSNYGAGSKPSLQELASEAYARLALINRQDGNTQAALEEFQQALDLSALPERRGLYWASMGDLYQKSGDTEKATNAIRGAIKQYQLAIALPISIEKKAFYWARIGEQYTLLNEKQQAIYAYQQALNLLPTDAKDYATYQQRLEALIP